MTKELTKEQGMKELKRLKKEGNLGNYYVLYESSNGNYFIDEFTDSASYCPGFKAIARVRCTG